MEKITEGEKLLNDIVNESVSLNRIGVIFMRNVFRNAHENGKMMKKSFFNQDHLFYLFIINDCLHNVPELTERCLKILDGDDESDFIFGLVNKEIQLLKKLITDESYVAENEIKIDNVIYGWMFEMKRMIPFIDSIEQNITDYINFSKGLDNKKD